MPSANDTTIRNRRFSKLQSLKQAGHYDEDQVMMRYPELYHQFVGKYKKYQCKSFKSMSEFYQAQAIHSQYRKIIKEKSQACMDEEQEQREVNIFGENQEQLEEISQQQLQMHQQALLDHLQLMFLDGKDPTVDYSKIDLNKDLDILQITEQESQQKYFDAPQSDDEEYNDPENNTGIQDF